MENKIQPQPEDSADEKTIEENLKEMSYDPKDDIMQQGEEVDDDLETNDQELTTTAEEQPSPEK